MSFSVVSQKVVFPFVWFFTFLACKSLLVAHIGMIEGFGRKRHVFTHGQFVFEWSEIVNLYLQEAKRGYHIRKKYFTNEQIENSKLYLPLYIRIWESAYKRTRWWLSKAEDANVLQIAIRIDCTWMAFFDSLVTLDWQMPRSHLNWTDTFC